MAEVGKGENPKVNPAASLKFVKFTEATLTPSTAFKGDPAWTIMLSVDAKSQPLLIGSVILTSGMVAPEGFMAVDNL